MSALRQIPSYAFLLYRRCKVGMALIEALDELLQSGEMDPQLAYKMVQQFDYCVAKELAKARTEGSPPTYRFHAAKLLTYRRLDNFTACVLQDVTVTQLLDPIAVRCFQQEYNLEMQVMDRCAWEAAKKHRADRKRRNAGTGADKTGSKKVINVRDKTTAVEVRVQHRLKYVCLLTYDPFEAYYSKRASFRYKFHPVACNVNPRLVFFTYEERRNKEADTEATATAAATCNVKEREKKDEVYAPRSLALKMDGGRLKAEAFRAKTVYWRK